MQGEEGMEQAEEELNNTGAPLETKIIQMFEDNTENITDEETNRIQNFCK